MKTPAHWQHRGFTAQILRPLSWLYTAARTVHRQWRLKHCYWAGVPVISVGNITTGGAGKTPVVAALARHFAEQGEQVAILSRGYGGRWTTPTQVTPTTTAAEAGDEPVMLARQLAHLPVQVWVGRHRPATAARAEQAGATLLILDDGFQRDDIARTVDLLVIDGATVYGNGLCLPAGPLREPLAALKRADFAVILNPVETTPAYLQLPAYRLTTQYPDDHLQKLHKTPLVAFAGIAHPQKFFSQLAGHGLKVVATRAFADHAPYTEKDLKNLHKLAQKHKAQLITTEKDAARLTTQQAASILTMPQTLTGDDWPDILADIEKKLA